MSHIGLMFARAMEICLYQAGLIRRLKFLTNENLRLLEPLKAFTRVAFINVLCIISLYSSSDQLSAMESEWRHACKRIFR